MATWGSYFGLTKQPEPELVPGAPTKPGEKAIVVKLLPIDGSVLAQTASVPTKVDIQDEKPVGTEQPAISNLFPVSNALRTIEPILDEDDVVKPLSDFSTRAAKLGLGLNGPAKAPAKPTLRSNSQAARAARLLGYGAPTMDEEPAKAPGQMTEVSKPKSELNTQKAMPQANTAMPVTGRNVPEMPSFMRSGSREETSSTNSSSEDALPASGSLTSASSAIQIPSISSVLPRFPGFITKAFSPATSVTPSSDADDKALPKLPPSNTIVTRKVLPTRPTLDTKAPTTTEKSVPLLQRSQTVNDTSYSTSSRVPLRSQSQNQDSRRPRGQNGSLAALDEMMTGLEAEFTRSPVAFEGSPRSAGSSLDDVMAGIEAMIAPSPLKTPVRRETTSTADSGVRGLRLPRRAKDNVSALDEIMAGLEDLTIPASNANTRPIVKKPSFRDIALAATGPKMASVVEREIAAENMRRFLMYELKAKQILKEKEAMDLEREQMEEELRVIAEEDAIIEAEEAEMRRWFEEEERLRLEEEAEEERERIELERIRLEQEAEAKRKREQFLEQERLAKIEAERLSEEIRQYERQQEEERKRLAIEAEEEQERLRRKEKREREEREAEEIENERRERKKAAWLKKKAEEEEARKRQQVLRQQRANAEEEMERQAYLEQQRERREYEENAFRIEEEERQRAQDKAQRIAEIAFQRGQTQFSQTRQPAQQMFNDSDSEDIDPNDKGAQMRKAEGKIKRAFAGLAMEKAGITPRGNQASRPVPQSPGFLGSRRVLDPRPARVGLPSGGPRGGGVPPGAKSNPPSRSNTSRTAGSTRTIAPAPRTGGSTRGRNGTYGGF